jgi:hypothetical protein
MRHSLSTLSGVVLATGLLVGCESLTDAQILDRLRATGQVFELTPEQQRHLLGAGVSQHVVTEMQLINYDKRRRLLGRADVLGR